MFAPCSSLPLTSFSCPSQTANKSKSNGSETVLPFFEETQPLCSAHQDLLSGEGEEGVKRHTTAPFVIFSLLCHCCHVICMCTSIPLLLLGYYSSSVSSPFTQHQRLPHLSSFSTHHTHTHFFFFFVDLRNVINVLHHTCSTHIHMVIDTLHYIYNPSFSHIHSTYTHTLK